MLKAVLPVLLLAAAVLAGCASQTDVPPARAPLDPAVLSQPIYGIRAAQEVWIASSQDGKRLDNAVFRPDTPAGVRVPVYINFSPYHGDRAMKGDDAFAQYMIHEYVPRGYAVVLSSIRGTGHSEGCFQIGGDLELKDTYDVVDWFSKQPWSNGNVAAGGKSYDSTTQNGMVAKFPHPALKGIFHVSGITDMYRYNAKDGVVYRNGLTFNHAYEQQGLHEYGIYIPPPPPGTPSTPSTPVDPSEVYGGGSPEGASSPDDEDAASLARLADDAACTEMPAIEANGLATAASGAKTPYWQERDWSQFLPKSSWNGSVFFVHGLQDWNVKPDDIDPWVEELQAKGIHVLGWLHQERSNLGHVYPMRQDWNETMLRWLDGTLKGIDTHLDALWGFDVQGSDGAWRHTASWPPTQAGQALLNGTGLQGVGAPGASVRVAGVPWATVTVVPQGSDDIARLALYDQSPDGSMQFVNEAVRRLGLSDDLTAERPYPVGEPMTVNLTFYPMDHELAPGHSWFVQAGAPTSEANGYGESTPPNFFFTPDQVTGVDYPALAIHLPLAQSVGSLDPQPLHMRCFTC